MDVDAVGEHGVDRAGELLVGCVLDDVALRSELECLAGVGGLVLHREDHDARSALSQCGNRVEARAVAQGQVEHDDLGLQPASLIERIADGRGLADDLELPGLLEHAPDPAPHELVIVDEEDADHGASARVAKRTRPPPLSGLSSSTRPATMRARSIMPSMP